MNAAPNIRLSEIPSNPALDGLTVDAVEVDVLDGDETLEQSAAVDHQDLLDLVLLHQVLAALRGGTRAHRDQALLGHHVADEAVGVALEAQVAVGEDTDRAAVNGDRYAGDLVALHELLRLADAAISVFNVLDYGRQVYDMAVRRDLIRLGEFVSNRAVNFKGGSSADDIYSELEAKMFELVSGDDKSGPKPLAFHLKDSIAKINEAYQGDTTRIGVKTGLDDLDKLLGGLSNAGVTYLAGRPSMGKSALARWMGLNMAVRGDIIQCAPVNGRFALPSASSIRPRSLSTFCKSGVAVIVRT